MRPNRRSRQITAAVLVAAVASGAYLYLDHKDREDDATRALAERREQLRLESEALAQKKASAAREKERSERSSRAEAPAAMSQGKMPELSGQWEGRKSACKKDADCVVSCYADGSCCGSSCNCANVISRGFSEALDAQRKRSCNRAVCATTICPDPCKAITARCVRGTCTAETRALPCKKPATGECAPNDPMCGPP
jgi:hypothetical protein